MDISEHISSLLFIHECVIIPDFGGFIANYKPAVYSNETHVFYPPSKTIAFNSNLKTNDGLLINHVSKYDGLSYIDARNKVSNFVTNINNELFSGKTFIFKETGSFIKQNDNIVFSPDITTNRLIEAFGLPTLQLPIEYNTKVKPIFSANTSSKLNLLQKAAVVIPFVLLFSLVPQKISNIVNSTNSTTSFYSNSLNKNNLLNNPSSFSDVIDNLTKTENALYYSESKPIRNDIKEIKIDTLINSDSAFSQKYITENKVVESKNETVLTPPSNKKYFIIAGSFVEMKRVNVFCNELKSKNFNPELVNRDGKLRISVGSFESSDDANASITLFKQQHPEYPVWLLSI